MLFYCIICYYCTYKIYSFFNQIPLKIIIFMKKLLFVLACFLLLFACNPADLGNQEPLIDDTEITLDDTEITFGDRKNAAQRAKARKFP